MLKFLAGGWGEPRGSFENGSVSVSEHLALFTCAGGNWGEILHWGVCAFKCAKEKLRESSESL